MNQKRQDGAAHDLEQLLDELDRVRSRVGEMLATQSAANDQYIDQKTSPLGPRRHIRAIRAGELLGFQRGRRWLARVDDVREYARRLGRRQLASRAGPMDRSNARADESALKALAAEAGFVAVADDDGSATRD